MQTIERPDYELHGRVVAAAILIAQPRNGRAYDDVRSRQVREKIAVNIHRGFGPFDVV